jgi:outer membrane protein assembly factor BamB
MKLVDVALLTIALALTTGLAVAGEARIDPAAASAAEILKAAGRDRGLCIQLGGESKLAAALHGQGRWLVVFLAPDPDDVTAARKTIRSLGLYGPVSADRCQLVALPLAGSQANIVVIDNPAQATKDGLSASEVLRVLCPNGVALIRSGAGANELAKALKAAGGSDATAAGAWLRVEKPRPAGHDDWTHPRYAANRSNVSRDKMVGPPEQLQWLAGPVFPSASHHYGTILSARGRNYYVLTAGQARLPTFAGGAVADDPSSAMPRPRKPRYWLVARDAYNGLPLWRRRYDGTSTTLVADAGKLYTMIGSVAVAIDGATGRTVAAYGKVDYAPRARFLFKDGILVISGSKSLRAVDTRSGKQAWTSPKPFKASFLIEGSRVIIFDGAAKALSALDLATGKEAWKVDCSARMKGKDRLLFGRNGLLVFDAEADKKVRHVTGVSAKNGAQLWTYQYDPVKNTARRTVLYAGGLVWVQKWMVAGSRKQQWEGLDPATGKSRKTLTAPRTSLYGCHSDAATDRHVIFNRPADFMAWADGTVSRFRASRPACRNGATLANGLFYSAPNICLCVRGNMHGFVGMAPATAGARIKVKAEDRLERGPAFGKPAPSVELSDADWPTFRRDPARSAAAPGKGFSPKLKVLWKTTVVAPRPTGASLLADEAAANWTGGEAVTAATVAGGKVFVGCPDQHRVVAIDAASGKPAWSTGIGGRMDVPPTIHGGLALAGGRDGWIYALRAADGALAWRFRAAPAERRIVAFGQVESTWPVVGGVMARGKLIYALAGRSSESDGGTRMVCLEPATGKLVWEQCPPAHAKTGFVGLADLLVADDKAVSCGGGTHYRLDPATGQLLSRTIINAVRAGTSNGQYYGYIGSASTLLDRNWHYQASARIASRFQTQWKDGLAGQIVVFDKTRAVAFRRKKTGKLTTNAVVAQTRIANVREKGKPLWSVDLPAGHQGEALALAGEYALVGTASADRKDGLLLVLDMKDGGQLAEYTLPGPIAAEGVVVAGGSVYVSTWAGELIRMAAEVK